MGQIHISFPGFTKPDVFNRTSGSSREKGLNAQLPSKEADESGPRDARDGHTREAVKHASDVRCKTIELRIVQDGKIYRSKAEEERLVALGQWHHRRARRRQRMRR